MLQRDTDLLVLSLKISKTSALVGNLDALLICTHRCHYVTNHSRCHQQFHWQLHNSLVQAHCHCQPWVPPLLLCHCCQDGCVLPTLEGLGGVLVIVLCVVLVLFLSCCTTSCWRCSSISVLLLIKERLLWAFNVDRHIVLKSLNELSTKILMSKYDTCLVLSSDAFSLMTLDNQPTQLLQSCLVGDLFFHLVLVTVEPWVPLPKIVTTVTCPTGHNMALHDARSQQIMAHKFLKEHLTDLCSSIH